MPHPSSSRIVVITLILTAFAAIAVNAKWGNGFGLSAANGKAVIEQEKTTVASQPRVMTTPLNAITSFDMAAIARHVNGTVTLPTVNHLCAADVSNNGAISAVDETTLARYILSLPNTGLAGTIVPAPCHQNYQTTIPVLKGEVTGQTPVITGGVAGTVAVSLAAVSATPGTVTIPITIGNMTGLDISSYDLQITFDPAVLALQGVPVDSTGTLSSTASVTANGAIPGHLIVSAFRTAGVFGGAGTLLNLKFNIVGAAGQSTALTFEDYTSSDSRAHQGFLFNEGTPFASLTNGSFTIPGVSSSPTSTPSGTPTPTTPLNAITSFDSAVIMRHLAGTNPLPTNNHLCAAEVTGNGAITVSDALTISRYAASEGLAFGGWGATGTTVQPPCDNWPTSDPVLKGDVSGQMPVITGGVPGTVAVSLPAVTSPRGSILIPVTVGNMTDMDISSYDFQITYDPTVIRPRLESFTIDQAGTLSSAMTIIASADNSPDPGHLFISGAQAAALTGSGTLLNLRFDLIGAPGSFTFLTFENYTDHDAGVKHQDFLFDEGTPSAQKANGSVSISSSSPTATGTPTMTATATPTNTPISTLGNYPDKSTELSGGTTVVPDAPPANAVSMTVTTDTNFKGKLEGDPVSGVVRVTNAYPGGMHLITVRAFDANGNSSSRTFTLTITTTPPCTPVAFASPAYFPGIIGITEVAVGDFNRDGKQDFVTADSDNGTVSVRLGDGTGGFGPTAYFFVGGFANSVAVGDFNGDGKQDLVVANYLAAAILLGDGTGGFSNPTNFYAGVAPKYAAVGDFNNDGKPDLAVASVIPSQVSILLGNGTGGFGLPASFGFGASPSALTVGDFNHDGNQDVAAANSDGAGYHDAVWVLLGNGRGGFAAATERSGPFELQSISAGDFNGDANQDLILGGQLRDVVFGNGIGGFVGGATLGSGPSASMAVGDFNGDTNLDVVASSGAGVLIYLGNGSGSFSPAITFNVNFPDSGVRAVAVGDFDGNGKQDVAVSTTGETSGVLILLRDCSGLATSIQGTVTYGNAIGSPNPRAVSNVRIQGTGSPGIAAISDFPSGMNSLTGFGPGPYTLAPDLTGQINGAITSFDAAKIAQHASGAVLLNANQVAVADVSGNGTVTSFDAAQIARYVANLPPFGSTGTWRFNPVSRSYAAVTTNVAGEDYSAMLMGEVSGNWTNSAGRSASGGESMPAVAEPQDQGGQTAEKRRFWPTERASVVGTPTSDSANGTGEPRVSAGPERGVAVELPSVAVSVGKEMVVPVSVGGISRKGVISYEFDLRYDPSVVQPLGDPVDLKDSVSRGLVAVTNAGEPGLLRVVVYGAMPIDENGMLLNLRFAAVGATGAVSPMVFERIMFNEGEHSVTKTDGLITVE